MSEILLVAAENLKLPLMIGGGIGTLIAGGVAALSGLQRGNNGIGSPDWGVARDRQLTALKAGIGSALLFTSGFAIPKADYNIRFVEKPVVRTIVKKVPVYKGVRTIVKHPPYQTFMDKCIEDQNDDGIDINERNTCHLQALVASGMKIQTIIKHQPSSYKEIFNTCGTWASPNVDRCHLIAMQASGKRPFVVEKKIPTIEYRNSKATAFKQVYETCMVGWTNPPSGDGGFIQRALALQNQRIEICKQAALQTAGG